MDEATLVGTRHALHAVGELVIAGPQHRAHGTIRLRVEPGGFGGTKLDVAVRGSELVWPGGSAPLTGSCRQLAAAAGLSAGAPEGLYEDGCAMGVDAPLVVDGDAVESLTSWLAIGDAALGRFAPEFEPVLWPEHFDLAITVDEVNYGVSLGDDDHPRPYAYVGPWEPRQGLFWNAPFGARRPAAELADADDVAAFFAAGRDAGRRRP